MVWTPLLLLSTYGEIDHKKSAFLASKSCNWGHLGGPACKTWYHLSYSEKKARAEYTNHLAIDKVTPRMHTNNLFCILHKLQFQLGLSPIMMTETIRAKPLSYYFLWSILLMRQIHASSRLLNDGIKINRTSHVKCLWLFIDENLSRQNHTSDYQYVCWCESLYVCIHHLITQSWVLVCYKHLITKGYDNLFLRKITCMSSLYYLS